jgi:hypothetical protein
METGNGHCSSTTTIPTIINKPPTCAPRHASRLTAPVAHVGGTKPPRRANHALTCDGAVAGTPTCAPSENDPSLNVNTSP